MTNIKVFFCRVLCPLGLLLGRASRSALIRLKASDTACPTECSICETACDLSLLPREGAVFDCNLCGRCVAQCPIDKLSIGIKTSSIKKGDVNKEGVINPETKQLNFCHSGESRNPVKHWMPDPRQGGIFVLLRQVRHDVVGLFIHRINKKSLFRKKLVIPFLLMVCFMLLSSITWAHHYKGLPHYGYFDNYPQVPTDEYIATNGPWEMNFTLYNFQGMTRSDVDTPDDLQVFLIIYNLRNDTTYGGNAQIAIKSGTKTIGSWSMVAEQESLYWFNTSILNTKKLRLFVNFVDDKGKEVEISAPFNLPGQGGHNPLLWIAGGLVVLIVLVAVGTKQTRKTKKGGKEK